MKKILKGLLVLSVAIGINGCAPSQAELLKEKQKREKLALERAKKLEKEKKEREKLALERAKKLEKEKQQKEKLALERAKKLEEEKQQRQKLATKYLKKKSDNKTIFSLLEKYKKEFKKDTYESKREYAERIKQLNKKIFNREYIFDYVPEYHSYDAETKTLNIVFDYDSYNPEKRSKVFVLTEKLIGVIEALNLSIGSFEYVYGDLPTNGTSYSEQKIDYRTYAKTTLLKANCSGLEAKEIEKNLGVRFVTKLKFGEVEEVGVSNSIKFYIANTDIVIIYNKKTNEIYKILF